MRGLLVAVSDTQYTFLKTKITRIIYYLLSVKREMTYAFVCIFFCMSRNLLRSKTLPEKNLSSSCAKTNNLTNRYCKIWKNCLLLYAPQTSSHPSTRLGYLISVIRFIVRRPMFAVAENLVTLCLDEENRRTSLVAIVKSFNKKLKRPPFSKNDLPKKLNF